MVKMKKFPVIKGVKLFLVGGGTRDHLLGKKPKDRDFVAITKYSFKRLVLEVEKWGRVFQAKPEFLTIRCSINNEVIDIVLPRADDTYSDGRRPDGVKRLKNLREDASRRDFRINSMYCDNRGKIIDFFGGQEDLKNKIIQCVGNPHERFSEDYLRILRAIRFSVQLDFKIHEGTLTAMKRYARMGLKQTEANRIREEVNKALKANPKKCVYYLNQLKLWDILEEKGLHFELTSKVK